VYFDCRERQNQEARELEKHKEKERLERDRQEREKIERDREKQERERELEKERQEQALHNHFEKSLRQAAAQQKREQWNPIGGRPPQPRTNNTEEERKRVEQELHQRGEPRHLTVRSERDHRAAYYSAVSVQFLFYGFVDDSILYFVL
jgi:serine phosphatase RsbU (regulator of sigma subunit)